MTGPSDPAAHWASTYETKGTREVSWFEREPTTSMELLAVAGLRSDSIVVDVGGGASMLVDRLLDLGVSDITVLDIAETAVRASQDRLGDRAGTVTWLVRDLLTWKPDRSFDRWHDRAVFHFLTDPDDRQRYRDVLAAALAPDGHVVVGTFAEDGPDQCSGLPVARYNSRTLADEFPGYIVVGEDREVHETPWGALQPFTWLVLRRGIKPR